MAQFRMFIGNLGEGVKGRSPLLLGLVSGCLLSSPALATISGVCPDGSIFIVQTEQSIPCRQAKRVAPTDIPPLNPELLPRPFGWNRFHERQDPNNPYNLVDSIESGPSASEPPVSRWTPRESSTGSSRVEASPRPVSVPDRFPALTPQELEDLAQIVELSQRRAPATFEKSEGSGVRLRIAHSKALESRLREVWRTAGGTPEGHPVVFSAAASQADRFYANLTFVQDSVAFHPNRDDARELGVLQGRLGRLGPDDRVLGYAWLPTSMDLKRSMDVYWNDRVLRTTLDPS
ncbi:hypothetical protein MK489_10110 [Myxococcota bacterium]|nr:hypothetical protein [Myxococcota bacterium]